MKKTCGIYKITSPIGKIYIGQSVNIHTRKLKYKNLLCISQCKLYSSFIKHGFNNHKFEIIHECLPEQLNGLEKYYVDLFQTFNSKFGMNLKDGGGSKVKHSEATKLKMRKPHKKGHKLSEEQRENCRKRMLGKRPSEETRKKLSESHKGQVSYWKGKTMPIEARIKQANAIRGRKQTPEHIEKCRQSRTGKRLSEETKLKISIAHTGKKYSEERIRQMSLVRQGIKIPNRSGVNHWTYKRKMLQLLS